MKRLRVMKQSEEYYEVPDDFELNELTFKELTPVISIIQGIQVLSVSQFAPDNINSKITNGEDQ